MENIISNKVIYKKCSICKQDVDDKLFYKIRDTYKLAKCKECYKKMMNDRYTKKIVIKIVTPPDPNLKVNRQIKIIKDKLLLRFSISYEGDSLDELKDIYNNHMKETRRLKKNEDLRAKTVLRKKAREELKIQKKLEISKVEVVE
jgi:hypothetical protein